MRWLIALVFLGACSPAINHSDYIIEGGQTLSNLARDTYTGITGGLLEGDDRPHPDAATHEQAASRGEGKRPPSDNATVPPTQTMPPPPNASPAPLPPLRMEGPSPLAAYEAQEARKAALLQEQQRRAALARANQQRQREQARQPKPLPHYEERDTVKVTRGSEEPPTETMQSKPKIVPSTKTAKAAPKTEDISAALAEEITTKRSDATPPTRSERHLIYRPE